MYSPINGSDKIHHLIALNVSTLESKFRKRFGIKIDSFFNNIQTISLYKCLESGYRFYHPYIAGDGNFYKELSKFDWYYMPLKWEHRKSFEFLKSNDNILEIGCGEGGFLEYIKEKNNTINTTGLELNLDAQKKACKKGLNVSSENMEQHSVKFPSHYDIVCSFQVLEHIAEVKPFISQQIDCLKSGGKLIIAVPDNDSFPKYDFENDLLNMPPHHMGLWNKESLNSLVRYFPIKLVSIHNEPLQSYHFEWYLDNVEKRIQYFSILLCKVYRRLQLRKIARLIIKKMADNITGHTIIAIYQKS